jgi:FAD/FMN-containing dehydrogenase
LPDAILPLLAELAGAGNLITGEPLTIRTNGYWDTSPTKAMAVVTPQTLIQLQAVLACCHQHRQAVTIQGGLTGTVRGQVAQPGEIAISLEKMSTITHFNPIDKTLIAEAGCTLQQIQEFARDRQLLLPIDIGARGSCTIGGNIATNAGGMEVLRYGMMRNHVLGLEAVLADGTLVSAMNQMKKNNTGYDLKQLFIGSEGTLGIVIKAVLQLQPLPTSRETALIACRSFTALTDVLDSAQRSLGETLTRFEIMDGDYFRAQTQPEGHRAPLADKHDWYALAEIAGYSPEGDRVQFETWLEFLLAADHAADIVIASNQKQREELWLIRENFDIAIAEKPFFLYDVSLPISAMEDYLAKLRGAIHCQWPGAKIYTLGHMADGNLHFFISPRCSGSEDELKLRADEWVYGELTAFSGSVSAEHGIGIDKKKCLHHCRSAEELQLMKSIKRLMDPYNLLNPGRIFDL